MYCTKLNQNRALPRCTAWKQLNFRTSGGKLIKQKNKTRSLVQDLCGLCNFDNGLIEQLSHNE
ncbi:hypothetical protein LOK49_LG01G03088 [Camellia lanceoleosa]|uniref:Uncharacterized protein n=1 Tax=Camellia lanceoleosa TaxID=1840588 RepID=A0ACC0IXE1_9ERIC|nr:hypothetical protein LOK49_LG01G03088 [Camellia lanceoleosa]